MSFAFIGKSNANVIETSAAADISLSSFSMYDGGQIRLPINSNGSTYTGGSLRFLATVPQADYEAFEAAYGEGAATDTTEWGIVFATRDKVETNDLNAANCFGSGGAQKYRWNKDTSASWATDSTNANGSVNMFTPVRYDNLDALSKNEWGNLINQNLVIEGKAGAAYYILSGAVSVPQAAYGTEVVARAYVRYSTDGGSTYTYKFADYACKDMDNNARSMSYVAQKYEDSDAEGNVYVGENAVDKYIVSSTVGYNIEYHFVDADGRAIVEKFVVDSSAYTVDSQIKMTWYEILSFNESVSIREKYDSYGAKVDWYNPNSVEVSKAYANNRTTFKLYYATELFSGTVSDDYDVLADTRIAEPYFTSWYDDGSANGVASSGEVQYDKAHTLAGDKYSKTYCFDGHDASNCEHVCDKVYCSDPAHNHSSHKLETKLGTNVLSFYAVSVNENGEFETMTFDNNRKWSGGINFADYEYVLLRFYSSIGGVSMSLLAGSDAYGYAATTGVHYPIVEGWNRILVNGKMIQDTINAYVAVNGSLAGSSTPYHPDGKLQFYIDGKDKPLQDWTLYFEDVIGVKPREEATLLHNGFASEADLDGMWIANVDLSINTDARYITEGTSSLRIADTRTQEIIDAGGWLGTSFYLFKDGKPITLAQMAHMELTFDFYCTQDIIIWCCGAVWTDTNPVKINAWNKIRMNGWRMVEGATSDMTSDHTAYNEETGELIIFFAIVPSSAGVHYIDNLRMEWTDKSNAVVELDDFIAIPGRTSNDVSDPVWQESLWRATQPSSTVVETKLNRCEAYGMDSQVKYWVATGGTAVLDTVTKTEGTYSIKVQAGAWNYINVFMRDTADAEIPVATLATYDYIAFDVFNASGQAMTLYYQDQATLKATLPANDWTTLTFTPAEVNAWFKPGHCTFYTLKDGATLYFDNVRGYKTESIEVPLPLYDTNNILSHPMWTAIPEELTNTDPNVTYTYEVKKNNQFIGYEVFNASAHTYCPSTGGTIMDTWHVRAVKNINESGSIRKIYSDWVLLEWGDATNGWWNQYLAQIGPNSGGIFKTPEITISENGVATIESIPGAVNGYGIRINGGEEIQYYRKRTFLLNDGDSISVRVMAAHKNDAPGITFVAGTHSYLDANGNKVPDTSTAAVVAGSVWSKPVVFEVEKWANLILKEKIIKDTDGNVIDTVYIETGETVYEIASAQGKVFKDVSRVKSTIDDSYAWKYVMGGYQTSGIFLFPLTIGSQPLTNQQLLSAKYIEVLVYAGPQNRTDGYISFNGTIPPDTELPASAGGARLIPGTWNALRIPTKGIYDTILAFKAGTMVADGDAMNKLPPYSNGTGDSRLSGYAMMQVTNASDGDYWIVDSARLVYEDQNTSATNASYWFTQHDYDTMPISAYNSLPPQPEDFDGNEVWANMVDIYEGLDYDKLIADYVECGINTMMGLYDYANFTGGLYEHVTDMLEKCAANDLAYIIRWAGTDSGDVTKENYSKESYATMRNWMMELAKYNALAGVMVLDEPGANAFKIAVESRETMEQYWGKDQLYHANLFGSYVTKGAMMTYRGDPLDGWWDNEAAVGGKYTYADYIEEYVRVYNPQVLSFDFYPIVGQTGAANGTGVDDTYLRTGYYENLALIRDAAVRHHIPFWSYIQTCAWAEGVRCPTESELLWNVNTTLAYGAKGIEYFCGVLPVSSDGVDGAEVFSFSLFDAQGNRNDVYNYAKRANMYIQSIDHVLMNASSRGVIFSGALPQFYEPVGVDAWSPVTEVAPTLGTLTSYGEVNTVGGNALVGCFDYQGKDAYYVVNNSTIDTNAVNLSIGKVSYGRTATVYAMKGSSAYLADGDAQSTPSINMQSLASATNGVRVTSNAWDGFYIANMAPGEAVLIVMD